MSFLLEEFIKYEVIFACFMKCAASLACSRQGLGAAGALLCARFIIAIIAGS